MIDENKLIEEIKSLQIIVNGVRVGKGILREFAKQYKERILRIIEEQPKVGEWIPVSERLPEYGELVLVETIYRDYELMDLTKMNGKDYFSNEEWLYRIDQINYWMPLPE